MLADWDTHIGQAAGIATSALWTATSLLFTAAGRRIGPTAVNAIRIALAIVLLGVTHRLLAGMWMPGFVDWQWQLAFLALSGIVGLSIGDQALFTAFVHIGPRLSMLIMTTAPLFAALFGWMVLGETLGGLAWAGIALTVGGVAWVVLERPLGTVPLYNPHRVRGVILAFIAAACQAGGFLLSKQGMGHGWPCDGEHLDPQAATFVRMVFAGLGMVPILTVHQLRERRRRAAGIEPRRGGSRRAGVALAAGAATLGSYLGVWMSLVAADRVALGIAQTLCSLTPVFILPFAVWINKEHVSPRAAIGAVIAVVGAALLFLKPA